MKPIILENPSYQFGPNCIHLIYGPSGAGKTTLLNRISRLHPSCGYAFQDNLLLPWKTAYENIELVLSGKRISESTRHTMIVEALSITNALHLINHKTKSLSMGEKQRINIARAIALKPNLLLLDEPFSHLDEKNAIEIMSKIVNKYKSNHTIIILVSHQINHLGQFIDKKIQLNERGGNE